MREIWHRKFRNRPNQSIFLTGHFALGRIRNSSSVKSKVETTSVSFGALLYANVMKISTFYASFNQSQDSRPVKIWLTPNTLLIHTSFTYPKLNMDEIYGWKFYLLYVHTSQIFLLKSLHAQKRSFLVLNLYF